MYNKDSLIVNFWYTHLISLVAKRTHNKLLWLGSSRNRVGGSKLLAPLNLNIYWLACYGHTNQTDRPIYIPAYNSAQHFKQNSICLEELYIWKPS